MKKNGKFFFGYSILLFSVAFVLILFSSFTGIRYQEAQDERNRLYQGAQTSVVKLTEENENLAKENSDANKKINDLDKKNQELEKSLKTEKEQKETVIKNMDNLAKAQGLYNNGEYSSAKKVIEEIDKTALSENSKKLYENLKKNLF